ncbi:TauD/TfdA family dioxygenase [Variovorax sp.]|uniref:TauD/TfdA dioxygenase family protein n=1 Tax=Variovorax sp. TaxID=1871043 RepID=UPI00137FE68A|nr:TauD/TfdA family dioxygenase [Variovorax sp.]KAF1061248.1 MAG: Alpha-ketoglutarate-dependent taurine dioxygenase [Variovorax sp.]
MTESTSSTVGHYRSFGLRRLTAAIGAEISGLDITAPLSQPQVDELHDALARHQVLFFRDQRFGLESHKAFGRRFGALHVHPSAPSHPEHPEVLRIHADADSKIVAGERWHSDVSCEQHPPLGSILYLHTLPPVGGDTLFASMFAAYDALSPRFKALLEGLTATHDGEHVFRGRFGNYGRPDDGRRHPRASHPVVRTHPVSGRKAIFVNPGFTTHIDGVPAAESEAILGFLFAHCAKPDFQVRFHWEPHSVAFWDNRSTQHLAVWDYFPHVRSGYRVTVQGDLPA